MPDKYNENPLIRTRRKTHEVKVGDIGIGGNNPIRIQSMTSSDTLDTLDTVLQVKKLIDAGCEIVRITAPSIKEAENFFHIKQEMKRQGLYVPLVADIHFTPNAAMKAVEFVEKVRINPGNYADRKKFEIREYSDNEYEQSLDEIREKFSPLVLKCKEYGVAMRIGTNHGSLSDRIMNRFGDSPEGMVESALEFVRICEEHNYKDVILSMKASNTQIMIQAYRLLASRMYELGMTYPFHLGVTEAGDGEDGRIKSAIGIGTLLEDGLGDTIRVSLTEDPWLEIPVAKQIVEKYNKPVEKQYPPKYDKITFHHPFVYERNLTHSVKGNFLEFGNGNLIRAGISLTHVPTEYELRNWLYQHGRIAETDDPKIEFISFPIMNEEDVVSLFQLIPAVRSFKMLPEFIFSVTQLDLIPIHLPKEIHFIEWLITNESTIEELYRLDLTGKAIILKVVEYNWNWTDFLTQVAEILNDKNVDHIILSGQTDGEFISFYRQLLEWRKQNEKDYPLLISDYSENLTNQDVIQKAVHFGALLADGLGDMVMLGGNGKNSDKKRVLYNILQAARQRTTKTEFISCPSCGRTLFKIQEATERIKARTHHLKGVKIAIMGCIVNGPGEMADADFGYVGSGPGKIDLYVGKQVVKKGVSPDLADEVLIDLIKENGRWIDPE